MAIDTGPALLKKTVHFPHGLVLVLTSAMLVSCGGGPSRHLIALTVQPTDVDASVPGGTVHFSATLAGSFKSGATQDSGGQVGSAYNHHGHNSGRWRQIQFVADQRAWNVDNPETLNGQEGHYVHAKANVYPDKDSIHII